MLNIAITGFNMPSETDYDIITYEERKGRWKKVFYYHHPSPDQEAPEEDKVIC